MYTFFGIFQKKVIEESSLHAASPQLAGPRVMCSSIKCPINKVTRGYKMHSQSNWVTHLSKRHFIEYLTKLYKIKLIIFHQITLLQTNTFVCLWSIFHIDFYEIFFMHFPSLFISWSNCWFDCCKSSINDK